MPTTPRITVAGALLISTLVATPAVAQPRVEVLLDRSELRTTMFGVIDANSERMLIDVPGQAPDTLDVGVFDLRSQDIIDVISVDELFDGPQPPYYQYRPSSWLAEFSEDLSVSVWSVGFRDRNFNESHATLARGASGTWVTPECEDQIFWFGHAISRDGMWVNSAYFASASEYESSHDYFRVRWSTATGACVEVQRYPLGSGGTVVATDADLRPTIIARITGSWNEGEVVYRYVGGGTPEDIVRLVSTPDHSRRLNNLVQVSSSPPLWYMTLDEFVQSTGFLQQQAMQWQPGGSLQPIPAPDGWQIPTLHRITENSTRGIGTLRMASSPFWEVPAIWTLGGGFVPLNTALTRLGLPALRNGYGSLNRDGTRMLAMHWEGDTYGEGPLTVLRYSDIFCDPLDFNNDGISPDAQDAEDYLAVLAGGPSACSTGDGSCNDLDFNNDAVTPDDADLAAFLRRLGGGSCDE